MTISFRPLGLFKTQKEAKMFSKNDVSWVLSQRKKEIKPKVLRAIRARLRNVRGEFLSQKQFDRVMGSEKTIALCQASFLEIEVA